MTEKEEILLLELILRDIKRNWGFKLEERVDRAFELAKELKMEAFIDSIDEFSLYMESGDCDGRYFRDDCEFGGYKGMDKLHGLCYTIKDKSKEFKRECNILTYPECWILDYNEYVEELNE